MGTRSGRRFKPGSPACRRYRMRTSRQPNRTSRQRPKRSTPASTRACWQSRWRVDCATRQHLRFVAKQPCLVCGRQPCDPHHLRFAQSRGLGLKVSDEFTVPLCRAHHRELHRAGKEVDWWTRDRHRADRLRAQALARNTSVGNLGKSRRRGRCGSRNKTRDRLEMRRQPFRRDGEWKVRKQIQLPGTPKMTSLPLNPTAAMPR